jgi:hypothetical protein
MENSYREYGRLSDSLGTHIANLVELWRIHEISRDRNQARRTWES